MNTKLTSTDHYNISILKYTAGLILCRYEVPRRYLQLVFMFVILIEFSIFFFLEIYIDDVTLNKIIAHCIHFT